jgi:hypothetical protein
MDSLSTNASLPHAAVPAEHSGAGPGPVTETARR